MRGRHRTTRQVAGVLSLHCISWVRRRLTAEKQELELSLRSGGDAVQDIKGKSWQELCLITKCTPCRPHCAD